MSLQHEDQQAAVDLVTPQPSTPVEEQHHQHENNNTSSSDTSSPSTQIETGFNEPQHTTTDHETVQNIQPTSVNTKKEQELSTTIDKPKGEYIIGGADDEEEVY